MTFIPIDPFPADPQALTTSVPGNQQRSNLVANQVIDATRTGVPTRELLTWRTPNLGYVKMYINPQRMTIDESKDIQTARTKGGFVIQYPGENLTQISIDGTTGSAGIEGINILEQVYRAEQESFEGIAIALEERVSVMQMSSITGLSSFLDPNLFQLASDSVRNFGRPQPTLASLAANIELFFQGVLYRGFFTKFSVTEQAPESGHFSYNTAFTAYAKQGVRRNFMPWHRQPLNPSGLAEADANQLSFPDIYIDPGLPRFPQTTGVVTNAGVAQPRQPAPILTTGRSTSIAVGFGGVNQIEADLRG